MKTKLKKSILITLSTILMLLIAFTAVFFLTSYKPTAEATKYLENSSLVEVDSENDNYITFSPKEKNTLTGLIIYPGAKVKPEAYAMLGNKIAQAGYKVIIVKMPVNFAIFNSNAAEDVISNYPDIKNWAISGHSLGGVMAAKYASENPDIKGIAFYASYPQGDELKDSTLEVVSIYGSEDGVADNNKVLEAKNTLPKDAKFIEIAGGNHGQFGSYGEQSGDNPAKISNTEQIDQIAKATIEMLENISK